MIDTLPPPLAAALDRLGIRTPPPPRQPEPVAWRPRPGDDEPPF